MATLPECPAAGVGGGGLGGGIPPISSCGGARPFPTDPAPGDPPQTLSEPPKCLPPTPTQPPSSSSTSFSLPCSPLPGDTPPILWGPPTSWDPPTPFSPPPSVLGGSRRVLFADALGLPLTHLRQYRPWDPRGGGGVGGEGSLGHLPTFGGGGEGGPWNWMRPGKGRLQEVENEQQPPPDWGAAADPSPLPLLDTNQSPAQEDEAVAQELEQLYLLHLRRLQGRGAGGNGDPPTQNLGESPPPERAPNTSLADEMTQRYQEEEEEDGRAGGRSSPPVLLGRGGPLEGALVVPARPPRGRGGGLGGALRGCGVVLALAVLVPVAWGGGDEGGGAPTAALALGIYLALAWLT